MGATLTVLGAGSILPRAGYGCAGYALRGEPGGAVTLLDCGPGSVRALGSAGIALGDVRRVVLSHFHPDHCLDVFALAFARRNPGFDALRARAPLSLRGPRGLAAVVRPPSEWPLARWVTEEGADVVEVEVDAEGRGGFEADGWRFSCVRTLHTPEALAWRVDLPDGSSLAYSGDTGETPAVAELARGVDLFVCECSFAEEEAVEHHLTPAGAGRLAAAAGCRRLLLTHFYPGLAPEEARGAAGAVFDGPILAAHDGLEVPLGAVSGSGGPSAAPLGAPS